MADKWAVANGNWSSTATWNGGSLPTSADDVYADGFSVTIDQSITVLSVRTTQRSGGTAGGGFIPTNGITINANAIMGTTSVLSPAANATFTLNGNVTGGSSTGAGLDIANAGVVCTMNGNTTGGSVNSAVGVRIQAASTLTLNGAVTGGTVSGAFGLNVLSSLSSTTLNTSSIANGAAGQAINAGIGDLTVNFGGGTGTLINSASGNLFVVSGAKRIVFNGNSVGRMYNMTGGRVLHNGNLTGSSLNNNAGATVGSSAASLIVVGNVTGGSGSNSPGITYTAGILCIQGNPTGSDTQSTSPGLNITAGENADVLVVVGSPTGGAAANGIVNSGGGTVRVMGRTINGAAAAISNTGSGGIQVTQVGTLVTPRGQGGGYDA